MQSDMAFLNGQIAVCMETETNTVQRFRHLQGIQPVTKQIDTLSCRMAGPNQLSISYLRWQ